MKIKKIVIFLIIFFWVLGLAKMSSAATYTCGTDGVDNSCTSAGMAALIASTSDGDTINIAAGTHDWTSSGNGVVINKRITISGGGSCPTCGTVAEPSGTWPATLTNTSESQMFRIYVTTPGTGIVRITGIKFYGYTAHIYNWWSDAQHAFITEVANYSPNNQNIATYRIDNNQFQNLTSAESFDAIDIVIMSMTYGLIDHNYFNHDHWDGHMIEIMRISQKDMEDVEAPDENPAGSSSWAEDTNFGSSNFVFVENNSAIYRCPDPPPLGRIFGTNFLDSFNGGRAIVRYNYITNGMFGTHDLSGGRSSRGARAYEVYSNIFNWVACGATDHFGSGLGLRGGTNLIYNNSITGWQNPISLMYIRTGWPACDNANVYDGPSSSPDGYRCLDQPGTGKASGDGLSTLQPQASEPIRIWNNTGNISGGCPATIQKNGWICNRNATYIIMDTDYLFSSDDSVRPAGYTPYTYPHPLQSAGAPTDTTPPTAPTNLTATAISSSQINLSWTASSDNVGVTGYRVERCQGSGCTSFTQIAAPSGTSYSDTGLTASTLYRYRVRATDAAGNPSSYSNIAEAVTQSTADTTPPAAPSGVTVI